MSYCCGDFTCPAAEQFNAQVAAKQLRAFRRGRLDASTRLLRDGIADVKLNSGTLLDVGAGIGAVGFELLDRGMTSVTSVEASQPYLDAARGEASRRGAGARVSFIHGDFVSAAAQMAPADVVVLDRVVCCYPDYERLIRESTRLARRGIALSYPRDRWYVKAVMGVENAVRSMTGKAFRTFVHPPDGIERLIRGAGFVPAWRRQTLVWRIDVYARN
ncbi:MAG TPA: class I SAM-dependent methyltransferase [Vicinamibacterales bacterium]|nr:class I SAM-dependent methyltransferase [Vicinamibacterales bacterium]